MDDFDTDEWDRKTSFAQHAVAGSIAGLAEHSVMFPVDTIKTLMQVHRTQQVHAVAAAEGAAGGGAMAIHDAGMASMVARLTSSGGMPRMWRGVQTMFTGCVPAHAAYFSIYEGCKASFNGEGLAAASAAAGGGASSSSSSSAAAAATAAAEGGGPSEGGSPLAAGAALALATMAHDVIMTPMDCIKQRLQLGHHSNSLVSAARAIWRQEGARAFVLSYPTTLLMNVPYALIMGSSNEAIRTAIGPYSSHPLTTYLVSGAAAGMIAAALTNPLDVVKTRLQTQHLCLAAPPLEHGSAAADAATAAAAASAAHGTGGSTTACSVAASASCPAKTDVGGAPRLGSGLSRSGGGCASLGAAGRPGAAPYTGMLQAASALWREGGALAFTRGMQARMLIHAPSVAICWGTYESIKGLLARYQILS